MSSTIRTKNALTVIVHRALAASAEDRAAPLREDRFVTRARQNRLEPYLQRVAGDVRTRKGGKVLARLLVDETARRARIAVQRAAGPAGSAGGARLTDAEMAAIADPSLRELVRAAAQLADAGEPAHPLPRSAPRPSGGTGGATGRILGAFRDSHGREGRYALHVPAGLARPFGLLVYFHADGDDQAYARHADELRAVAERHGLAVLSLQEPDRSCWWAPRSADNARYVEELVDEKVLRAYDVDQSRVFLSGESGGAAFAAGLPAYTHFRWGGGLLLCSSADLPRKNGGAPDADRSGPLLDHHPRVPERARRDLGVYFAVGSEDPELHNVLATADYYRRLGVTNLHLDLVHGAGHVGFDAHRAIAKGLAGFDASPGRDQR